MIATVLTDKRPVIKVSINGQETAALVDTGASLSIVSESDMGKFKFKRGSKMAGSVIGLDGTEQSMYHTGKDFDFKVEGIPAYQFVIGNIDAVKASIKKETGVEISAIIGYPTIKQLELIINPSTNEISIGYKD
mgnify:FL=1